MAAREDALAAEDGRLRPLTAALRHAPSFWASRPEQIKDDGMTRLYVRTGSDFHEATDEEIIASAQTLITRRFRKDARPLTNPDLTKAFLKLHLGSLNYEIFGILHLDSRNRLIDIENLFRGTLDVSAVYPREIAQSVLAHQTSRVILYHNHPSGVPAPSEADAMITKRVKEALALFDVKVIDHLIVGETIFSFAEAGLLDP
jgi:DNA repair protein RadC